MEYDKRLNRYKLRRYFSLVLGIITLTIVVFVLIPILFNFLYLWDSDASRGSTSDWISFFGSYFGAIVGGIVAYIVARQQVKLAEQRWENEEISQKDKIEGIISIFLIDELKQNYKIIHGNEWLNKRLKSNIDTPFQYGISNIKFYFNEFNQIKYELVKYTHQQDIWRVMEFYKIFIILDRVNDIQDIPVDEYKFISTRYKNLVQFMNKYSEYF